jgi:hypothetical protein
MNTDAFYGAASGLSFTLLGFWWAVVTFRHAELCSTDGSRRFAFVVSLYFLLPGLVAMVSLASGSGPLWRIAFGVVGVAGIVGAFLARRPPDTHAVLRTVMPWIWLSVPLYALMTLIALVPDTVRSTLNAEPLQVEAVMLVAVLFVGSQLAWSLFSQPTSDETTRRTADAAHG